MTVDALRQIGTGWDPERCCYTFPERGHHEVVGILTRTRNGRKRSIKGGRRGLNIPTNIDDLPDPLLIVEGPSDVAACLSLGLAAVGRPCNYGSKYLAHHLKDRDCIVVAEFDPNVRGEWPGVKGAKGTAQQLADESGRAVKWALLPDKSKDVRRWLQHRVRDPSNSKALAKCGRALVKELQSRVQLIEPGSRRLRIYTGAEIVEMKPPETQIKGMWAKGNFVVLYGPPACGKSFVASSHGLWPSRTLPTGGIVRRSADKRSISLRKDKAISGRDFRRGRWNTGDSRSMNSAWSLRPQKFLVLVGDGAEIGKSVVTNVSTLLSFSARENVTDLGVDTH